MMIPPVSGQDPQEDFSPRCFVGFSIIGSSLDFEGISEALNQKSAETRRAGSVHATRVLPKDVWSISSALDHLKPLEEHLQWLRAQLELHVDYLCDLSRTAILRVYVGFTFFQDQNGFTILSEHARFFSGINASIEVTILCAFGIDSDESTE